MDYRLSIFTQREPMISESSDEYPSSEGFVMFQQQFADRIDLNNVVSPSYNMGSKKKLETINNALMRACILEQKANAQDINGIVFEKNLTYIAEVLEMISYDRVYQTIHNLHKGHDASTQDHFRLQVNDNIKDWIQGTFHRSYYSQSKSIIRNVKIFSDDEDVDSIWKSESFARDTYLTEEMLLSLSNINNWNFDAFDWSLKAGDKKLQLMCYYIFHIHGLLHKFHIGNSEFMKFFNAIEQGYVKNNNLFHNETHACEVVQTCHFILNQTACLNNFSDIEIFAAFMVSAIHDFTNDGLSSVYHQLTQSDLAILYNDKSVHCNNSTSKAFFIALKKPGCNIFMGMSLEQYRRVRDAIIELCYSFDIPLCNDIISQSKRMLKHYEHFKSTIALQTILLCSDISHIAKSWQIHSRNIILGLEQFFQEGDKSKDLGYEVAWLMSRNVNACIESHMLYFDVIVEEAFNTLTRLLERMHHLKPFEYSQIDLHENPSDSSADCDRDDDLRTLVSIKRLQTSIWAHSLRESVSATKKRQHHKHYPWDDHIQDNKMRWKAGGIFRKIN